MRPDQQISPGVSHSLSTFRHDRVCVCRKAPGARARELEKQALSGCSHIFFAAPGRRKCACWHDYRDRLPSRRVRARCVSEECR